MKVAIIGGGIFGLYTAKRLLKDNHEVHVFEQGSSLGQGATRVNQARLHLGYHYPRSRKTAIQCISGFDKFYNEFKFAINDSFKQYYSIAKKGSKTNAEEYLNFCTEMGLPFEIVNLNDETISSKMIDLTITAREYSFDWRLIVDHLEKQVKANKGFIHLKHKMISGCLQQKKLVFDFEGKQVEDHFDVIINATYSNINGINKILRAPHIDMEYELCEMVVLKVPDEYKNLGITIMDGNYTSIMPFGFSGFHTISNVRRTPHEKSKSSMPEFKCNNKIENDLCNKDNLNICLNCPFKPLTWQEKMIDFAKDYIPWVVNCTFIDSLIAVKAIPSNVDATDERPSSIYDFDGLKGFYCLFSGKVDTVIDISNQLSAKIKSLEV